MLGLVGGPGYRFKQQKPKHGAEAVEEEATTVTIDIFKYLGIWYVVDEDAQFPIIICLIMGRLLVTETFDKDDG